MYGPGVFQNDELAYLQQHLRILSGFYGILRPLDGVTPYRLEMQGKLQGPGFKSLYQFWGTSWRINFNLKTIVF
nr:peroxide stress protein YaaA [Paenibacillus sp. ClWae2A]